MMVVRAAGKSWAATGDPEEGLVPTQSARLLPRRVDGGPQCGCSHKPGYVGQALAGMAPIPTQPPAQRLAPCLIGFYPLFCKGSSCCL